MIFFKSKRELEYMREASRIVASTHALLRKMIEPGITTKELNAAAEKHIRENQAEPSFLGYHGYPASICTSIDEAVVHGIPGNRTLKNGEIISIDIGAEYGGYHGDSAWTWPVGEVSEELLHLLLVTREALNRGIAQAVPGHRLTDISYAIQSYVENNGLAVVRDYVGHGIGRNMHEDPQIPNFGPPGHGPVLKEGMVLAIEPMVNLGTYEVYTASDEWTVKTKDGRPSAHFEHTVLVGPEGPEILTALEF